jgi:hypothetical protein
MRQYDEEIYLFLIDLSPSSFRLIVDGPLTGDVIRDNSMLDSDAVIEEVVHVTKSSNNHFKLDWIQL